MSCASTNAVFRLTLLVLTFIITCTFVASVVWLLRTKSLASKYENYYLSRINITSRVHEVNNTTAPSDHYKDLIKIEIAMRRVEENSRRVKEYSKALLWDNKDKSLWCMLFKDSARAAEKGSMDHAGNKHSLSEDYIRTLREQKMREAIIHLRHHGEHHRRRLDIGNFIK